MEPHIVLCYFMIWNQIYIYTSLTSNEAASFTIGEAASITFKLASSLTLVKVPQSHLRSFKAKDVFQGIVCVDLA